MLRDIFINRRNVIILMYFLGYLTIVSTIVTRFIIPNGTEWTDMVGLGVIVLFTYGLIFDMKDIIKYIPKK